MDVEKRLAADAEVLDRQVESIDFDAYLARVFAAVDALDGPEPLSSDTEVLAGRGDAASRAPAQKIPTQDDEGQEGWELRELRLREREALEEGSVWSCRRAAELLEIMNRFDEAAVWWRRAAAAGDLDAREYVADFLSK